MDRKTQLTMFIPEIMSSWNDYKKGLKGLKITNWCISSDYCFGDPDKQDVATFTIFPAKYIPVLLEEIKKNLPRDIKQIRDFSENELRRLRWYDIILYLTMMIEVFYREYEDKGQYQWAKEMLLGVL